MVLSNQLQDVIQWLSPLYAALYFAWPPFLIYLVGNRRRFLSHLITLWTLSGALSILLVLTHLNAVPLLPPLGPEPYNTIILVCIRLAILVTLACLNLQRAAAQQAAEGYSKVASPES